MKNRCWETEGGEGDKWLRSGQRREKWLLHSLCTPTLRGEHSVTWKNCSVGARPAKWATEQTLFSSFQQRHAGGPLHSSVAHCLSFLCFTETDREAEGVNGGLRCLHNPILQPNGKNSPRQELCCTTVSREIFLHVSGKLVQVEG